MDAIITIDEQGLVQSANQATEKLFGFSLDEVLGNNVNMLMPASYAEQHDDYLANYLQTGERKIIGIGREVEGRNKDGTQFPIDLSVSEFQLGDRRLFLGVARDIRERKKAEELEANLGRILEESLNEIFIFDAESLKFLQVNRGARNNLGYSMEELRELTPLDLKPEYSPASFAKLIEPVASRQRELLVFETVHQRKDGSRYDIEVHLQRTSYQGRDAFVAVIVDISDRVRAQKRLRVQQRAIESAVNGVVITDPNQPDNPIIYISPAVERMTGYSAEEVIGKNCRFLQNDDRHQESLKELRAAINEQRECRVVLRNYRKDGTPFWNELSIAPVRDPHGRLTHFVGIQSDITEKKKAEQELARLNRELESRVRERTRQLEEAQEALIRKEKLATLGQLAGGVAHEIRNPLGVIKNAVYFLNQTQTNGDGDTKEAIDEITRGLTNSERIISELLDYARAPESEASPFCLADAITGNVICVTCHRHRRANVIPFLLP